MRRFHDKNPTPKVSRFFDSPSTAETWEGGRRRCFFIFRARPMALEQALPLRILPSSHRVPPTLFGTFWIHPLKQPTFNLQIQSPNQSNTKNTFSYPSSFLTPSQHHPYPHWITTKLHTNKCLFSRSQPQDLKKCLRWSNLTPFPISNK